MVKRNRTDFFFREVSQPPKMSSAATACAQGAGQQLLFLAPNTEHLIDSKKGYSPFRFVDEPVINFSTYPYQLQKSSGEDTYGGELTVESRKVGDMLSHVYGTWHRCGIVGIRREAMEDGSYRYSLCQNRTNEETGEVEIWEPHYCNGSGFKTLKSVSHVIGTVGHVTYNPHSMFWDNLLMNPMGLEQKEEAGFFDDEDEIERELKLCQHSRKSKLMRVKIPMPGCRSQRQWFPLTCTTQNKSNFNIEFEELDKLVKEPELWEREREKNPSVSFRTCFRPDGKSLWNLTEDPRASFNCENLWTKTIPENLKFSIDGYYAIFTKAERLLWQNEKYSMSYPYVIPQIMATAKASAEKDKENVIVPLKVGNVISSMVTTVHTSYNWDRKDYFNSSAGYDVDDGLLLNPIAQYKFEWGGATRFARDGDYFWKTQTLQHAKRVPRTFPCAFVSFVNDASRTDICDGAPANAAKAESPTIILTLRKEAFGPRGCETETEARIFTTVWSWNRCDFVSGQITVYW